MRIVDSREFLDLPARTIYREIKERWLFGELSIKGDTLRSAINSDYDDFTTFEIGQIDSDGSYDFFSTLETMWSNSLISRDMDTEGFGRCGLYGGADRRFLILERKDVEGLLLVIGMCR